LRRNSAGYLFGTGLVILSGQRTVIIQQADSTQPGAHQRLHQAQGIHMTTIDALVVAAVGVGNELESQAIHRSQQEDSISVLSEQQEPVVAAFEEQETAVTEAVCRVWSKRSR
jgi:hypothetical protein